MVAYHGANRLALPKEIDVTIDDTKDVSSTTDTGQRTEIAKQPVQLRHISDVIDRLNDHSYNRDTNAWSYRVHWYDLDDTHDSWEPLSNLPRNMIIAYHKRRDIPIPDTIDLAIQG